jgi:hypothetical protein
MRQSETTQPDSPFSFAGSLFLFIIIIFISSAPVVIEQLNKPERIAFKVLSHSRTWQVIHTSTNQSQWEASDGGTTEPVHYRTTDDGVEFVFERTGNREAYFVKEAFTPDIFKLSVDVNASNGLVFRGNDQGEYYLFLVSPTTYTVEILQRANNVDLPREAIIPNTALPKFIGLPHTLTILGDGHSYLFYINNVLVGNMSDSRLYGNRVGIEVFT